MAYKLRDRNEDLLVYRERSSSDSESDSDGYDDPDYSNRPMRRQPRQQHQHIPGNVGMADHLNMNSATGLVRRRPSRPPRNPAPAPAQNQAPNIAPIPERRRRRRRAPYSLQKPSNGPRFQEKRAILALLMDMGRVEDNQLVYYWDQVKSKVTLHGKITRAGIHCRCYEKVVTVSEFEDHARSGFKGEPYRNIALRDGTTLFVCQFVAWCKIMELSGWSLLNNDFEPKKNAMDKSDDACIVCADGGDLICCEKCPSTFHFSCLNMERIPQDDWLCAYCVCKHCGLSEGDTEISECTLCEKTYHLACYDQKELNLNITSTKFCGKICEEVHEKLQKMVGVQNELDGGFFWTLLHHDRPLSDEKGNPYQMLQHNCKIAVAWNMMDQCFKTIVDGHTKTNVVQHVIYNARSNYTRLDFKGFYTAILEKNDEVICAASLRLHGTKMAEVPFVATHRRYRKRGMLSKLLVAVESALCYLRVENLVIPSSEEAVAMWINKFNFSTIPKSLEKDVIRSNMLMFPKAVKLYKALLSDAAATETERVNDDNDTKGVAPTSSTKRIPLFDLNLLPLKEDEGKDVV